jgi:hypothetical protein
MQCIRDWLGAVLTLLPSLLGFQLPGFMLNLVELLDVLDRLTGDLALARDM